MLLGISPELIVLVGGRSRACGFCVSPRPRSGPWRERLGWRVGCEEWNPRTAGCILVSFVSGGFPVGVL